jgi:glycosyltransferase involved in cell wall biosynthesis
MELEADVPDVRPYLYRARATVVPLRVGSGTRLKALESMAAGRPVIGTSIGLAGLGIHDGEHALVADAAGTFAQAVVRVLEDDTLATELSLAGRQHVVERFRWETCVAPFGDLMTQLADRADP